MKKLIVIKNKEKGQSMIEMVFAITIVALVITGVVVLIVNSIGIKSRSFNRKKAMEMAEVVMEDLVNQKKNNSVLFWQKNTKTGETLANFSGYFYDVGFSGMNDCSGDCTMVLVTVRWGDNQSIQVNKFFSGEVN